MDRLYPHISERLVLFLVGAVQFVNILDFMMVMPLGPDFAADLNIDTAHLGWVGGSYTLAAAFSGIVSSLFIDRLDRKRAMLYALGGLIVATALGGFAWDAPSLIATRVMAGMCGGPATSLAWAIVADMVEPARRGQAMGKVMGAFSIAAIFGVPFGLMMSRVADWTAPFFVTALLGALVMAAFHRTMPSMRAHLAIGNPPVSIRHLLRLLARPQHILVFLYISLAMMASFMIIPNISAYIQYNHHYSRDALGWLYCAGGVVSFITTRITGHMIDRFSASRVSLFSAACYVAVLWTAFIQPYAALPVIWFFMLFMFALGMRNVSSTTLATKIPSPQDRAGFMSLFSCIQSLGMATGAFLSVFLLTENADKSLAGMDRLAMIAIVLSLPVPLLMRVVEGHLRRPR